ncbi:MAG: four helix bundle protein [Gemmataceae bacterium]
MNRPFEITERTFEFGVLIVQFCEKLGQRAGARRTLANQLLRAGTSIGANVEEAQAGYSRKEFICKYQIALKEARETRYWLRIISHARLVAADAVQELIQEATELSRILGAIVVKARGQGQTS